MTKDMGMGLRNSQMVTLIKESIAMEKPMEKVSLHGSMVKCMTVNGLMVLKKVTAFGKALKEIATLVNGKTPRLMVMVYIFGRMVISMKESGKHVLDMVMVLISLPMVISILVSTDMGIRKALVNIDGLMVILTLVNLKTV